MKMSTDYASLFNFTLPQAMEKFQAAVVGSVKPIRDKTGMDITEKTIQQVAKNIGVEKTVGQLNQVEKRLLRIISLQDQLGEIGAIGDFSKTLESPSNQLKVLQQQLQELGVWLGNVFIGTIGKILPYINGFVMALVAMAKALAIFVGYTETKYENDPLQIEDTTSSVDDLDNSLGGATARAKELKKVLMGFDVLNVITTPTESSGGGGAGSDLEVDPAILNALKEYDNLMEGVNMKATEIRDKIMDWLGFEKIINEETGEITWKLRDGYTNLEKIFDIAKAIGVALIGSFAIKKIAEFIIFLGNLKKAFGQVSGAVGKLTPQLKTHSRAGAATGTNWSKLVTILGKAVSIISGIVIGVKGFTDMLKANSNAVAKVNGELDDYNTYQKDGVKAAIELAAGGALIGAAFGPLGAIIGSVSGALVGLVTSIVGYFQIQAAVEENSKKTYDFITLTDAEIEKATNSMVENSQRQLDALIQQKEALQSMSDSVIESIGSLDKLSFKYAALSTQISEEDGKKILENISTLASESVNLVQESTTQQLAIISKSFEKTNVLTEEQEKDILKTIKDSGTNKEKKIKESEKNITAIYENASKEKRAITEDEYKIISEQLEKIRKLTNIELQLAAGEQLSIKKKLSDDSYKISGDSYERLSTQIKENEKTILNNIESSYNERYALALQSAQDAYDTAIQNGKDIAEAEQIKNDTLKGLTATFQDEYKQEIESANKENQEINKRFTDRLLKDWIDLNQKSESELSKTEKENKAKMENLLKEYGYTTSELIQLSLEAGGKSGKELTRGFDENKSPLQAAIAMPDGYGVGKKIATNVSQGFKDFLRLNTKFATTYENGIASQTNRGYLTLSGFATGGFPEVGEMFIAREAGPELVGSIGNRTAVVNNQQIVESVSRGVAEAVSRVMGTQGGNYNFYLDSEQMTAVVTKKQNRQLSVMGV